MRIDLPEDRPTFRMSAKEGGTIVLSPLLKTDRRMLAGGLEELTVESRYARFGQGVGSLSERELDYLSDVDQHTHVAWGAALDGEAVGVGRYIVSAPGECAEFAITVIDPFQRRGVGTALFRALAAVARRDGVHELCFEAQPDNRAVMQIMHDLELAPFAVQGTVTGRIRLGDIPLHEDEAALVDLMESVRP